ncbi:MAG: TonB-dependent receptor [Rubrivivax sp.]|nr:TonB-dependent receptor [Rubrivivax sp.]MDP3225565.1 TonB-dependent receptor [Rubrivivax sp.]MDP3611089.1 TonB-dependent receptor [Rubrivivax sp.]
MSLFVRARARSAVAAAFPFLGLGVSPIALAQVSTASPAETVVVTATRTPQRVDQALAQVTVISRARIEAASGRTLAELLASESGVQSWSNGGLGKNASVSLRGLESRHSLLLIDGVRYGSATLGTPSWDNIPLDAIERIEIVRGPMSGLYGSDAVGGVIQIFTRRGQQGFHPELAATLGSRSYGVLAAGARFGSGAFDGSLRLQHRRTDGFSGTNPRVPFGNYDPDDDGFDQTSVTGRAGLRLGDWRADATLLKAEGKTHYDDGPGADTRAKLRTEVISAQLAGPVTGAWRTSLKASRSRDDFDTLASTRASNLGNIGTTQTQLGWENQIATPLGTALVLAERVQQEVERPGTPFAVSERSVTGLALGLNGEAGAHGWQANLRRDRNSQFGGQTTGSLGYGYELAPGLRATASFGTSFVAPSFNQLYFPGFGNPNLLPEEGRQREVGLVWRSGPVTSRVAYFDNRIRGYISSGPLPTNIPRVKVDGISASVDAVLGAWTLAGSIDSIQPVNATEGTANFGRILPRRVQDSGRLAVDWRSGGITLGGSLQAFGERFDNANNSTRLGGFATLDLRAEWAFARDWVLAAKLNNALGKTYETVFGYNQPGREGFVTLRWAPR